MRMNWHGFSRLIGQCVAVCSRLVGTQVCAELSGDMRSFDMDSGEEEMAGPSWETPPAPAISSNEGGAGESAGRSKSSATAHLSCKECGTCTVSGHLLSWDAERDTN